MKMNKKKAKIKNNNSLKYLFRKNIKLILNKLKNINNEIEYWIKISTPAILIDNKYAEAIENKRINLKLILFSFIKFSKRVKLIYVHINHTDINGTSLGLNIACPNKYGYVKYNIVPKIQKLSLSIIFLNIR